MFAVTNSRKLVIQWVGHLLSTGNQVSAALSEDVRLSEYAYLAVMPLGNGTTNQMIHYEGT